MKKSGTYGYSLIELLVVVGIIGIISAFAVPAFMNFQRSIKIKTSLRQLTSDLRAARQAAVTQRQVTKLTFETDPAADRRYYEVMVWDAANAEWDPFPRPDTPRRQLGDTVYFFTDATHKTFPNTEFPDGATPDTDTRVEIVFEPTGTIRDDEEVAGTTERSIWIRCDDDIPFNQMQVSFQLTGNLTTQQSKWN